MIGLGSNRLTVCRRGGMSVTQAGKGGMEWLGSRVPLWSQWWLPYSRQAGEALLAQFPTQWPTIRDYGFAHPELVEYVNAHPIGWGRFIAYYQECEYIQGTGTQYMQTDTPAGEYEVDMKVVVTGDTSVNGYGVAFISNTENVSGLGQFYYSGAYRFFGPSGYNKTFTGNTLLNLHIKEKDGVYQLISNGETIYEGTRAYPSTAGSLVLMARTKGTKSVARLKQYTIIGTLNGSDMYVIPCYHKTSGTIGMYDVVNDKFYENSGTGTFGKGADVN